MSASWDMSVTYSERDRLSPRREIKRRGDCTVGDMPNFPAAETGRPSGVGASNGTSRKTPFDRWFRYPAGFSPLALHQVFDQARNPAAGAVVDPFCGAGTVGTHASALGLAFAGLEAHPEIAELARLKLSAGPTDPETLMSEAAHLIAAAGRGDVAGEADLVQRCFSAEILRQLVGMREAVQQAPEWTRPYFKWALLATLRDVACVNVGWPYLRPNLARTPSCSDPGTRFVTRVKWMAEDIAARGTQLPGACVVAGDAARAESWSSLAGDEPRTICLTSPPYLNNFDYADATRLEMFFWRRHLTWRDMCDDVRSGMLVATTQQSTVTASERALEELSEWPNLRREVASLVLLLKSERLRRNRGKEYDRVLPSYLLGIAGVLNQLHRTLQPGSWCGWVVGDSAPYGIYVDTPELIRQTAGAMGYELGPSEILRHRGHRWRTNGTRHQLCLDERLVWFRTATV